MSEQNNRALLTNKILSYLQLELKLMKLLVYVEIVLYLKRFLLSSIELSFQKK